MGRRSVNPSAASVGRVAALLQSAGDGAKLARDGEAKRDDDNNSDDRDERQDEAVFG